MARLRSSLRSCRSCQFPRCELSVRTRAVCRSIASHVRVHVRIPTSRSAPWCFSTPHITAIDLQRSVNILCCYMCRVVAVPGEAPTILTVASATCMIGPSYAHAGRGVFSAAFARALPSARDTGRVCCVVRELRMLRSSYVHVSVVGQFRFAAQAFRTSAAVCP